MRSSSSARTAGAVAKPRSRIAASMARLRARAFAFSNASSEPKSLRRSPFVASFAISSRSFGVRNGSRPSASRGSLKSVEAR